MSLTSSVVGTVHSGGERHATAQMMSGSSTASASASSDAASAHGDAVVACKVAVVATLMVTAKKERK